MRLPASKQTGFGRIAAYLTLARNGEKGVEVGDLRPHTKMDTQLLPLLLAAIMTFVSDAHQAVNLRLSSTEYSFQRGHAVLIRSDVLPDPKELAELSTPSSEEDAFPPQEASVLDNLVWEVRISEPGKFRCMWVDLLVVRVRDQKQFRIPSLVLPELKLTALDLQKGEADIDVQPAGLFQIVALDKERRPIPKKRLHFVTTEMTWSVTTDDNGEVVILGNPNHLAITHNGPESFGLLIMPL